MPTNRVNMETSVEKLKGIVLGEAVNTETWSINQISEEARISYTNLWRWLYGPRTLTNQEKEALVNWINRNLSRPPDECVLAQAMNPEFISIHGTIDDLSKQFDKCTTPICVEDGDTLVGVMTIDGFRNLRWKPADTLLSDLTNYFEPFVKVSCNIGPKKLNSLMELLPFVLIEEKGKINGIVVPVEEEPVATFRRDPKHDDYDAAYADVDLPRKAAGILIAVLQKRGWFRKGLKTLDVGTGPLSFPRVFFERQQRVFKQECISVTAVEHDCAHKWLAIANKIRAKIGAEMIDIRFEGLEKLSKYGTDFDLVVWSLTIPTVEGISQLPGILKPDGKVIASFYHKDTLREIDEILGPTAALACQRYHSLVQMYDFARVFSRMASRGIKNEESTVAEVDCSFKNSDEFLQFISSSIAPVGSLFLKYPKIKKDLWENALKLIESKYGKEKFVVRFKLNVISGEKIPY